MTTLALYDLSRLLDRVHAINHDLEDISVTTVDGSVDPEVRKAAGEVLTALESLQSTIEDRLGEPSNYREATVGV